MDKIYKVWIEIEEDTGDEYNNIPVEFGATAGFKKLEDAMEFAAKLHEHGKNGRI